MNNSPYAPPQHPQDPYGGGGYGQYYGPAYQFQPLGWKTPASIVGMVATVVLQFLQTGVTVALADKIQAQDLGALAIVGLLGMLTGGVAIGTYIFFLMWMHQANKNVRAFGQLGLEFTPGWCVGWWFIPFASLVKPFQAMREIWRASDPDTVGPRVEDMAWKSAPVPATLGLWWATYIGSGIIGVIVAFANIDLAGAMAGKPANNGVSPMQFVVHALLGIAGVFIIMIMRQIAQRQEAAWARVWSAAYGSPHAHGPGPAYSAAP